MFLTLFILLPSNPPALSKSSSWDQERGEREGGRGERKGGGREGGKEGGREGWGGSREAGREGEWMKTVCDKVGVPSVCSVLCV